MRTLTTPGLSYTAYSRLIWGRKACAVRDSHGRLKRAVAAPDDALQAFLGVNFVNFRVAETGMTAQAGPFKRLHYGAQDYKKSRML